LVHLAASVMSGHGSAVTALARFGSAAREDPIYEPGVQLGKLLSLLGDRPGHPAKRSIADSSGALSKCCIS
jgi:hypothetical protein